MKIFKDGDCVPASGVYAACIQRIDWSNAWRTSKDTGSNLAGCVPRESYIGWTSRASRHRFAAT